jgi:hypothetical protein
VCLDGVGLGGLPGTPERSEDGAVGAEARGESVLVLHGGHELERLVGDRRPGFVGGGCGDARDGAREVMVASEGGAPAWSMWAKTRRAAVGPGKEDRSAAARRWRSWLYW